MFDLKTLTLLFPSNLCGYSCLSLSYWAYNPQFLEGRNTTTWIKVQLCPSSNALILCPLTPWSRVLLEKLIGPHLVKKLPTFYGTRSSLPHAQQPATWPCPDSEPSSPLHPYHLSKTSLYIFPLSIPRWSLAVLFPHAVWIYHLPQTCYMPRPPQSS
jgi:hypothetical protein